MSGARSRDERLAWCRRLEAAASRQALEHILAREIDDERHRIALLKYAAIDERTGKPDTLLWSAYNHFRRIYTWGACPACGAGMIGKYGNPLVPPTCPLGCG